MDTSPWDTVTTKSAGDDEGWTAFGDNSDNAASDVNDNSGWADFSNIDETPAEDGGPRASSPDALIDNSSSEHMSRDKHISHDAVAASSNNSSQGSLTENDSRTNDYNMANVAEPQNSSESECSNKVVESVVPPSYEALGLSPSNIKKYEEDDIQNASVINNAVTMEVVRTGIYTSTQKCAITANHG